MMHHLDNARMELRHALEEHEGSRELDALTRLVLEAVRAINAARREVAAIESDGRQGSPTPGSARVGEP